MKTDYTLIFPTYEEFRVAANASDAFAKIWNLAGKGLSFCNDNDIPELMEMFYAIQDAMTEAGFE